LDELDARFTVAPVEALIPTEQVLDAPGARVVGMHARLLTVVGAVMLTLPPVVVTGMPLALGEAPKPLTRPIVAPLLPESVTETVPTNPSPMVVAFTPHATHTYPLAVPLQFTVLPADSNAAPALTLRLETAAAG
jgi:hypothetical protein